MWAGDGRPDVRAPGGKMGSLRAGPRAQGRAGLGRRAQRGGVCLSLVSICVWTPRTNGIKTKQNPSPVIRTEPVLAGQVNQA